MFEITAQDGEARTGLLHTAHGKLKTPFYMPVGTKASVKNISPFCLAGISPIFLIFLSVRGTTSAMLKRLGTHQFSATSSHHSLG